MAILADALIRSLEQATSDKETLASRNPLATTSGAHPPVDGIGYTKTRVIEVSKVLLRENRIIAGFEPGSIIDAYKIMCIQTLQRLRARNANALAIVSPGEGDGKTLTAINLSLSFAQEVDQTVLLVDANLRVPSVHRYFGFTPEAGLSDYMLAGTPLDKILVNPGLPRFVILPGGRPLINSAEMLGSMKMVKLVQELKMRYPSRLIVFDLPPVLSAADALAFSPYVDAAIMVARERKTRREDLVRAAEMLRSVELIGTVLNMASEAPADVQATSSRWRR